MSAPSVSGYDGDSALINTTTGRRNKRAFVAHRPLLHSRVPSYGRNLNKLAPAGGGVLLPRPGSGLRLATRLHTGTAGRHDDGDGEGEWGEMSTETSREHSSDGTNPPSSNINTSVNGAGSANSRQTTSSLNTKPTTKQTAPKVRFNTGDSASDNDDDDTCTIPPLRPTPQLLQRKPSSILAPALTPHTAVSHPPAATSPARSSTFIPDSPHRRSSPSPPILPLSSHGPNRTQQKIWLQRQASGYSHAQNPPPIVPHPRIVKEIDRISRELASIRLFRNPLAESIERVCGRGMSFRRRDSMTPSTSRSVPKHVENPSGMSSDVKYRLWNP